jgi:hypothetical protein
LGALTLAAFVFFVQDAPSSPYARPWDWGGRSLADQARIDAVAMIEPQHRVRTAVPPLAELAERRFVVVADDSRAVGGRAFTAGVEAVLLDETITGEWGQVRYNAVLRAILDEGFELALDRHGVLLFLRAGQP